MRRYIRSTAWGGKEDRAPFSVKAWVEFGATGTVTIRDSYNVIDITDNAAGDFTVNFQRALQNTSYIVAGSISANAFVRIQSAGNKGTTSCRIQVINATGGGVDTTVNSVLFIGR